MFEGQYTLHGVETSIFTRKLQCQLQYQRIAHEFVLKSQQNAKDIESRVGTHFIPVLKTPEGWYLTDSTPIGQFLNLRYPDRSVMPSGPVQRIAAHLLEDFLDEWLGLYAIHSRWCYEEGIATGGEAIARNMAMGKWLDEPLSAEEQTQATALSQDFLQRFGLPACRNRGCLHEQGELIRADFNRLLDSLLDHFRAQPFLLGSRACIADFMLAAGFKAHFAYDAPPKAWVAERAPSLFAEAERLWRAEHADGAWLADDQLPATVMPLFDHMVDTYHRFLDVSRRALQAGEKWCELDLGSGPVRMRALRYSELSRRHVRDEILRLDADERIRVDHALGPTGALRAYLEA